MKIHFNHPSFDGQLLRVLSHTYTGSADIGECLSTAAKITEGSFDSWHKNWLMAAERLFRQAECAMRRGHNVSAFESFMRSSNYYRVSTFFHYESPLQPEILEAFDRHLLAFDQALSLSAICYRKVELPFEREAIQGYLYRPEHEYSKRATLILNGGADSTQQESYFSLAPLALRRGYNVFTFDGPGQGVMLFHDRKAMRHDWETVITPIVDYLIEQPEVDGEKIALYGPSFGGMLAPRAAAYERRLAALIVNPGQWDALENIKSALLPEEGTGSSETVKVEEFLQMALQDKYFAKKFHSKRFVHAVESPTELIKEWENYNLSSIAQLIECPTLVCDAENEPYSEGQAKKLFDALRCQKKYHLFASAQGAGEHCSAGSLGYLSQVLFDWLDELLMECREIGGNREGLRASCHL